MKTPTKLVQPEFDYVARAKCGCVVGLTADMGDKETANSVARFIKEGCTIDRIHRSQLSEVLKNGFGCSCEDKETEAQPSLFGGAA